MMGLAGGDPVPGELEATLPQIRIRDLSLPEPLVIQKNLFKESAGWPNGNGRS